MAKAAWTRKEGKNPSGGLNKKGRDSYKIGVLNFLGEKEYGDINSVFGKEDSMHLKP